MAKLMINKNKKEGTIAPEIYGHFSEHLGRCIYEGLYVGENSEIPNVNGMRTDVVERTKELKISGAMVPSFLFLLIINFAIFLYSFWIYCTPQSFLVVSCSRKTKHRIFRFIGHFH